MIRHLLQHVIKIRLEAVGQLLDIILTLDRTNIFHLIQNLLNAITEATANLPKLRRNRIKRILKRRLATAHTFFARLDGITELRIVLQLRMIMPQHPQERRNEHQHGVPQTLQRNVGYRNTFVCYKFSTTLRIIPNELLQSLGQILDKFTTGTIQSLNDLPNLCTKIGIRPFNTLM
ncbi:uncharacterized protein BcabD6B2_37050 [Babesia caballi]|uniref:Uncharacterized protein n=1 Tax=Babesia caballi TaxID=5871 RepID=A0AAV4LWJ5_BABCB|nr:hypothetical protein BcabD6B2_37050 [Babesia caballi]